jgi:hypothetical protein
MVNTLLVTAGALGREAGPTPMQAGSSDTAVAGGIAAHQRSINGQDSGTARMPGAPAPDDDARS